MKLSPNNQFIWSVVFSFPRLFFSHTFFLFSLNFFSLFPFSLFFFLVPPSLNPIFFLGTPTYSSNLPTSLPPPNPSTYPITHLRFPPSLMELTEVGELGEPVELAKAEEVVELVKSLWSLGS